MPFGISLAPKVFQHWMCEVVEGLKGLEIVADDLVVVGFGDTDEEAAKDHDRNLEATLQHCKERNIKLNEKKMRLQLKEVPFTCIRLTQEGLSVDPNKVQAILDMPLLKDVAAVQRLLGFAQYLSNFLSPLSDITKPLRELTKNVMELGCHSTEFFGESLKKVVSSTPVLRHYNVQ